MTKFMGASSIQVCMDYIQCPQEKVAMDHQDDMMRCSPTLLERGGLKPQPEKALKCPRCESTNTKFCYYNNYSLSQPRYFCKTCRRYWTKGGTLRNVPVGGSCRKNKRAKRSPPDQSLAGQTELTSTSTHGDQDHNNNNDFRSCCTLDSENIASLSNSMYYGAGNNNNDIIINKAFPRIQEAGGDGFPFTNSNNSDFLGSTCGGRPSLSNYLSPISSLATLWAANSTQLIRPITSSTFSVPGFDKSLKWVNDHEAALCPADPNSIMPSHQQISEPTNFAPFTMDCGLNRVHPDRVQWRPLHEQQQQKFDPPMQKNEGHAMQLRLEDQIVENPCRQSKALEDFMSSFGSNKGGLEVKEWQEPSDKTNYETAKDSIYWNGRSWPYLQNYASSSVSPLI